MKVRCIAVMQCSSLTMGSIYTVESEKTNENGEDFYCIKEVDKGRNLFFTWRFQKLVSKLNNNVKVL